MRTRPRRIAALGGCLLLALVVAACSKRDDASATAVGPGPDGGASAAASVRAESAQASTSEADAGAKASGAEALRCPEGMVLLPGGPFWVGSERSERFSEDESPRFRTVLAPFCLDETEVTVSAYKACVERGACEPAGIKHYHCNAKRAGRDDHPINCVNWNQADAFCRARGARLPKEVEFEYAARGGERYLKYPWGADSPDGRTCWKHVGTCRVKSYEAGAFGLYDISGNVWEWTADYYGPYPWPPEKAYARVYRGGSFSRRFEKWMHTRLRNRQMPWEEGSHLGFRCALTPPGAVCPFGAAEDGSCRHGVEDAVCSEGKRWNGVRCAAPGEPRCREGRVEKPGYGCVLEEEVPVQSRDVEAELKLVTRSRSPEFDADCQANFRDRPRAFRYVGGTSPARTLVGKRDGCKNRDVGVGWNSACCT